MGDRANLLIVEETGYKLFYCHWCAYGLPRDVFWGPEFAIPFVLQQRPVDEKGWLDTIWAEGGVIIDPARHVLLLYGGEDIAWEVPLRRVYLELLQEVWQGWHIQWAYNGILDIAGYVNLPRETVLAKTEETEETSQENLLKLLSRDGPPVGIVVSFVFEDGSLRLFPLWGGDMERPLRTGPALIELARNAASLDDLPLDQWKRGFPTGGFHIDLTIHQVVFWTAYDRPTITEDVSRAWPGWTVLYMNDVYESQLERTRGKLTFPIRSADELLVELEGILVRDFTGNQGTSALQCAEALRRAGYDVQVNPDALRDDPQEVPLAMQRQIFDRAVAAWRKRRAAAGNTD